MSRFPNPMPGPLACSFVLCLGLGAAAHAQDTGPFSENSEARSWNLAFEVPARFDATVVDLLCEVAGDCANQCASGRQLALLRHADGVLTYPNKNTQPAFTGAAVELEPFCGANVEVDGLMIEDEYVGATNIYLVQRIREIGSQDWTRANRWTAEWAEANPDAQGDGPWFRRDPRVLEAIAADGYLGTGESHAEAWEVTR